MTQREPLQHFSEAELAGVIEKLLDEQPLAVLATQQGGRPYATLVAFAWTPDLKCLAFATPRATRKFEHMQSNPRVALLVDNRTGRQEDFHEAMALTVLGAARESSGNERGRLLDSYLERHSALADFVQSPSTALMVVDVERYILVRQFQNVLELRMAPPR